MPYRPLTYPLQTWFSPPAWISSPIHPFTLARTSLFPSCSLPLIGRSPLRSLGSSPTQGLGESSPISVSPRYKTAPHSSFYTIKRNISQMNTLKSHTLQFLNAIDHLANSLQPMNLIPPEMVSRIATYLIDEVEYCRPLLAATHISRYWRETILGCSSLWTSIDSRHPRLAIVCMERSNTARLVVKLRPNVTLDFVSNLRLHMKRIKALDTKMPPSDFKKLLPRLDLHSMKLESMILDLNSVHPLPCVSFPPLLSLDMSELKVLTVRNVSLMPPFFRPTNLSKLSIISSDGCLSTLLDLIAANTHLEEILIISPVSDLSYPSGDVVSLPHLRMLNVTLPWHAIRMLLRRLSLPPSANLIVTTAMHEHDPRGFLPTLLPETLDPLQNLLKIETLTYHYSQIANYQILCGSSLSNVPQTRSHLSSGGSFTFRWPAFARFDLAFSPLSLSHVRHLQFNLDCVYSFRSVQVEPADRTACQNLCTDGRDWYSEWRGVFRSLSQLERLTVVRLRDLGELVDLLMDHTKPRGSSPQLDVCPAIGRRLEHRSLCVSSIRSTPLPLPEPKGCQTDFLCPLLHTLEFIECHWLCSQFPVLLDFVKHRAFFTSPQGPPVPYGVSSILHIRIQNSRVSLLPRSRHIEELRELVDNVVTEVAPQKCFTSRGAGAGNYGRKPPLCVVCGTDLGLG